MRGLSAIVALATRAAVIAAQVTPRPARKRGRCNDGRQIARVQKHECRPEGRLCSCASG